MAEVKRKLRIINDKDIDKTCVHNFKKGQVVFTEDSVDSGHSIVNAYHTMRIQNMFHSDYEEVQPVTGGDIVVSKVSLSSLTEKENIEANSQLEIMGVLSEDYFLVKSGEIRTVAHRSEFFALCDRVVQREDSEFAEDENEDKEVSEESNPNPVGMGGTIFEIRKDDITNLIIRVIWDNKQTNSYRSDNLEFEDKSEYGVKSPTPIPIKEEEKKVQKYRPKIGDIVKISNKSKFFKQEDNPSNPKCKGVVTKDNGIASMPYCVKWDNGKINIYEEEDLVVLKKSK